MNFENKKLIVVLGMHRSGTSTVTRALLTMGVALGDRLMSPVEGNNSKGFWEDIDINELNIEMLNAIDSDWHFVSPISSGDVTFLIDKGYKKRAINLILDKLTDKVIFGFKDPRVAKLLPFWKVVIEECKLDASYVLVVRNPLSVAKSLEERDGFPREKSYLLWIGHVIESLSIVNQSKVLIVDYDLMLESPTKELNRIAKKLDLDISNEELVRFNSDFIDGKLRHTFYDLESLKNDSLCPSFLVDVYSLLHDLANDSSSLNDPLIQKLIINYLNQFDKFQLSFQYQSPKLLVDKIFSKAISLELKLSESARQKKDVQRDLDEHVNKIHTLNHDIQIKDQLLGKLNNDIELKDQHLGRLSVAIENNSHHLSKHLESIDALKMELQIKSDMIVERNRSIDELQQIVKTLTNDLIEIRKSTSWVVTKPLRAISKIINLSCPNIQRNVLLLKSNISSYQYIKQIKANFRKLKNVGFINLPEDFDVDFYATMNPDLNSADMDLRLHYINHGVNEGRLYKLPNIEFNKNVSFDVDKETVLVVSHEATLTGAPVLSLNLVKNFSQNYNVIVLLLGDGILIDEFKNSSVAIQLVKNIRLNPYLAGLTINQIERLFKIKFAIVNSIESRYVLPALYQHLIPSISLIHEFAAITKPTCAFDFVFDWADEVVFSADITLENAKNLYHLDNREVHIIPQGKCTLPESQSSREESEKEKKRIINLMRPSTLPKETIVVLGVGTIYIRKGVDLFIDCANRLVNNYKLKNCHFVWIGKDVPNVDPLYSTYLNDQISRVGLHDYVTIIDETFAIEAAYENADIFLMTSRLDPLPNVAIDAMEFGVPVICFENTTGIVQFLSDKNLNNHCVVPYLDTEKMAQLVLKYAEDANLRKDIGSRCKDACISYFNMNDYINSLSELANKAYFDNELRKEQLLLDIETIDSSGLLRPDFYDPNYKANQNQNLSRTYILNWSLNRKPCPGFHPKVYLEQHGVKSKEINPFADYIRSGMPEGPWCYQVIDNKLSISDDFSNDFKVGLHIHAFYPDLLHKIISSLNCNKTKPDLFISVTNHESLLEVETIIIDYIGVTVDIKIVPNLGRDVGPLITEFGETIYKDYDFFGHIHTKKTTHQHAELGQRWFNFLIENLIGGDSGPMMDRVFTAIQNDEEIGMVFPDDPNTLSWTENFKYAKKLADKIGIMELPEYFIFPVGTMFWARTSTLKFFLDLKLDWSDYPNEPLPMDGTILHAIERLFPLVLSGKYKIVTTNVVGLSR